MRPNYLFIVADDLNSWIGCLGRHPDVRTPNIDRVAKEGMIFTDYYGEQSCTAGRSSYIMGQSVYRTGLSKVGLPGAELGIQEEDPTIAGLLIVGVQEIVIRIQPVEGFIVEEMNLLFAGHFDARMCT